MGELLNGLSNSENEYSKMILKTGMQSVSIIRKTEIKR